MEKLPNNAEKTANDHYRKIGQIGVLYHNASVEDSETYWENIDPYLDPNRERHAQMYAGLLADSYGHISGGVGGTFEADHEAAQYIMGPVDEMYKQVKIKRHIMDGSGSDQEFFCKYSKDDDTLYLCYGADYDYDYESEGLDGHNYYGDLQLRNKYMHFYLIASEVWKAHQINNPDKYKTFSKKELAEEADLYASHILMDGLEKEREYWQGQIQAVVYPSPAERLFNIEKLLGKLKHS